MRHSDMDNMPYEVPRIKPAWLDETVQSLTTLNDKKIPELKWIVKDLLTEGLTVFAGILKSGKSLFITNVGIAIAEGLPVLGQTIAEQGRVLYITPDDKSEARLRARIRDLRQGRDTSIPFDIALNWPDLDAGESPTRLGEGIQQIDEYLEYYTDTKLVIIDVLKCILPNIKEDADAYDKIYRKLAPLKDVAQKHHVAIVPVMHMNKGSGGGGGNSRMRIYGSMAYGAVADNILTLDEDFSTHQRTLGLCGKDLDQGEYAMNFDKPTGMYTYGDLRMEELQIKNASNEIGDIVRQRPGITRKELMTLLQMDNTNLNKVALDARIYRARQAKQISDDTRLQGYHPYVTTD
jgi:AAA domain